MTNFKVRSDLVLVPVTVTDGKGREVSGLNKENFTIYQDKIEQEITHFASEDAPASIGIVFDGSGSMSPKLKAAREAVANLLNNSNQADEFFLVAVSGQPKLSAPFTAQKENIENALAGVVMGGSTPLLDAISLALDEMRNAHFNRKALVIISDGEDNASRCTLRTLKERISDDDVLTYAIGLTDPPNSMNWPPPVRTGSALLSDITKETGGRLFDVYRSKELGETAARIGSLIRGQYVLGYYPGSSLTSRKYHRIKVQLTRTSGLPKLHAAWRLGYYAPSE